VGIDRVLLRCKRFHSYSRALHLIVALYPPFPKDPDGPSFPPGHVSLAVTACQAHRSGSPVAILPDVLQPPYRGRFTLIKLSALKMVNGFGSGKKDIFIRVHETALPGLTRLLIWLKGCAVHRQGSL
jgi:hypothetical protein